MILWLHPVRGLISPGQFIPLVEDTGPILAINISPRQFRQSDFVKQVIAAVYQYGISPQLLKLGITEGMLLENVEDTIEKMDKSTGYSSLQYLKQLPLDQLKIDQSFIQNIVSDGNDQVIVRTIIAMANSLGLNVIAEGVETEPQRKSLLDKGCACFQGYLFGKPIPVSEFERNLKTSR